jgi:hypothetical protein
VEGEESLEVTPEEVNGSTSQTLQNGVELLQCVVFSSDPDKAMGVSPRIPKGFVLGAKSDDALLSDSPITVILVSFVFHIHGHTELPILPLEWLRKVVVPFRWLSIDAS